MTAAYSVFANQGLAFPPYLFERITDANGDLLEQTHPDAREVASPQAAFQLLQMLKGVTQRGTARLRGAPEAEHRGKDRHDERLHRRVVHRDDAPLHDRRLGRQRHEDRQHRHGHGRGARVALPIWIRIVEKMKDGGRIDPKEDFDAPPNVVFTAVDYETGLKATPTPRARSSKPSSPARSRPRNGTRAGRRSPGSPGRSSSPSTCPRRASTGAGETSPPADAPPTTD